jgi:hypothetical protein
MPRRRTAALVPALALVGLAAVPATGSAAVLTPNQACYTRVPTQASQTITVGVSGGNPSTRFQVFGVGGKAGSVTGTLDAAGNGTASIVNGFSTGGISPSAGRTITLAVNEFPVGAPSGQTGSVNVKVTNLALELARTPQSAYAKRVWKISGLAPLTGGTRTVYASWYSGKKLVKRVKLGTGNECGYLRVKRSGFPSRKYRSLTLRVHAQPKWSKDLPYLKTSIRVVKRYL